MKNRTRYSNARWLTALAGLLGSILLCATVATAGEPKGIAFVDSVNSTSRTISLRGTPYRVATSAVITSIAGQPIRLSGLRPIPDGLEGVSTNEADIVAWEAVEGPNGWTITALRVLEDMPH